MSTRRTSLRRPRRGRVLLTGGIAVAVALLPGTAVAEGQDPATPLDDVTTTVEETVGGLPGAATGGASEGTDAETTAPAGQAPFGDAPAGEAPAAPQLPAELDPEQLEELFAQLGIPADCVEDVAAGVEEIVTGLQETLDPAQLEQLLANLEAGFLALQEGGRPELPPTLTDAELVADLEALAASLEECLAAGLPTGEEPPAPTEQPAPPVHEAPAAPAAAPQAVSYPGYAPTGVEAPEETSAPAPLAALGAGLLLVGAAGVAGSRMRTRAVHDEG